MKLELIELVFILFLGLVSGDPQKLTSGCPQRSKNATRQSSEDFWKGVKGEENIVKLNEDTFHEFTQERAWVHFYNTWCWVFRDSRESIANIATALKEMDYPGGVGVFECHGTTDDKPICKEVEDKCWIYNVYYYRGKYIEYYPFATKGYEKWGIDFMIGHIEKPDEKTWGDTSC